MVRAAYRNRTDDLRITSSGIEGSQRFVAVQRVPAYVLEPVWTVLDGNSVMSCRSWRTMLAQHLSGDMAKGNRDSHALTTWWQTRVTAVDMGRYGWPLDGAFAGTVRGARAGMPAFAGLTG